ncbi:MAG: hypothetical protein JWO65_1243 [Sphingomonas bacterium]|nr:hypothetical protein [Sphingomonas bacterium]
MLRPIIDNLAVDERMRDTDGIDGTLHRLHLESGTGWIDPPVAMRMGGQRIYPDVADRPAPPHPGAARVPDEIGNDAVSKIGGGHAG